MKKIVGFSVVACLVAPGAFAQGIASVFDQKSQYVSLSENADGQNAVVGEEGAVPSIVRKEDVRFEKHHGGSVLGDVWKEQLAQKELLAEINAYDDGESLGNDYFVVEHAQVKQESQWVIVSANIRAEDGTNQNVSVQVPSLGSSERVRVGLFELEVEWTSTDEEGDAFDFWFYTPGTDQIRTVTAQVIIERK